MKKKSKLKSYKCKLAETQNNGIIFYGPSINSAKKKFRSFCIKRQKNGESSICGKGNYCPLGLEILENIKISPTNIKFKKF